MQSDTFLPDTDSSDEEYASDSSGDLPKTNNIGVKYDFPIRDIEDKRFLDQSSQSKYLQLRNELFTPQIESGRIVFYTHYTLDGGTSYKNKIDLVDKYKLGNVKNVIGFELISADIKNGDTSHSPFIDLHISEIPHKACKQNEYGIPIISRIKTFVSDTTNYNLHEPQRSYSNFFSPIQLSSLTLQLLDKTGSTITENHPEIIFEFEIMILKDSLSKR